MHPNLRRGPDPRPVSSSDPPADSGFLSAVPIDVAMTRSGLDFATIVLLVMLDVEGGPAIRSFSTDDGIMVSLDDAVAAGAAVRDLATEGGAA